MSPVRSRFRSTVSWSLLLLLLELLEALLVEVLPLVLLAFLGFTDSLLVLVSLGVSFEVSFLALFLLSSPLLVLSVRWERSLLSEVWVVLAAFR